MKKVCAFVTGLAMLCCLVCMGAPHATAKDVILVGAHLPLSGVSASVGRDQKWAYERAVEDVNASGGIFVKELGTKLPVKLIVEDDQSNPAKAAAAVEKLIKGHKVDLLLSGQVGALGVLPGMVTAEKYQKYYHGTVIWAPMFLSQNFQWSTMYFVEIPDITSMPFKAWNTLPESRRPQRIGLFVEDSVDGRRTAEGLTAAASAHGYTVVDTQLLKVGAKDFRPQIHASKSKGVDAAICFANVPETAVLLKQIREMNLGLKYFQGIKGAWSYEFWKAVGEQGEGVLCDGFWSMDYPYPGAKELGQRYFEDHGYYSVGVGMYYALCQTLWQAIEKAGTLDGAKVRQAVLDNTFQTVNGPVDYDERGVAFFPMADFQWRDGKQVLIYPSELTSTSLESLQ
ncbi:branched-chain amino acid transport system substrate-binding protein [Desulfacinum infernum DSM 9756]|uniref:Branched-chain amino acid transport system substrate-binding protein n=1 Tax=Desulfacinum infernum DSM 9756 TaxID=1121391 RepID=A0A1M5G7J0_9BACT|nr:amino acid ABC transporter substrate-binding protein [Desulfacinum infernum]SHF99703.1 branched-chain amino acid transport system substrate-binding protein [Desulfacinum infernum DSM 9756]